MKTISTAAFLICIGILLGAFGAHALEDVVTADRLDVWETATSYLLFNAVGLLAISIWNHTHQVLPRALPILLISGIALFSGSLFLLVALDIPQLGAITPLGGLALAGAWGWLGVTLWSKSSA